MEVSQKVQYEFMHLYVCLVGWDQKGATPSDYVMYAGITGGWVTWCYVTGGHVTQDARGGGGTTLLYRYH